MTLRQKFAAGVAGAAVVMGLGALEAPVLAQGLALEEIVVTARKREERLQEVPLSITAFSSEDIERKGFKGLEDIALAAPGVQYHNQGGQIPGRYTSAIRFRGMNVNSDSPSLQLGSLFIDGIYVLGGTQSIPLNDIERIEVIKGPQSAYFGRNTFGGAINYITKNPSLTEYSGKISASGATYSEYDVSGSHEGPIVADRLSYRVGARLYGRGAMWRASDGGGLGEESSKSVNATLYAEPTDNFRVKLRGFYNKDEDGAAAGGIISGIRNDSCTGKTVATQDPAAPNARPQNYICGAVPSQGTAISNLGNTQIIDSNTSLMPGRAALLGRPTVLRDFLIGRPNPPQVNVPDIDHVGLVRDVFRFSGSFDYDFADGYTATVQGGYNRLRANWIRDFGLSAIENWYSKDPQDSKDYSIEARVASPTEDRLSWLIGANYYHQDFIQSGSGGDAVALCLPFTNPAAGAPVPFATAGSYAGCPTTVFTTANTLVQNSDAIDAYGVFASLTFQVTEQITAIAEGRYQRNEAATGVLTATPTVNKENNFLPRVILRYQPTPETNLYASYAKGVIQGQPNAQIAIATPNELRQYQALLPGIGAVLPAEILDMWELGLKQQFWDGRANVNIAGYYGKWKGQKGRGVALIQEDCGSPSHGFTGGCTTGSAPIGLGTPGTPARLLDGSPFFNSRNVNAPGNSKLWGVEFEGAVALAEGWDANLNVTYAKSKYESFLFNFVQPIAGFSQMKGNQNARFPTWSGSLSSQYTGTLNETYSWFLGGDVFYVGKTYVDESNLAYCKPYWTVNTRLGVEKDGFRVEAFVRNLFNDDSWTACARWTDFDQNISLASLTVRQGVAVTQNNKRQFGLRTSIEF
jgi:iron complex outermembrane receptor protein